MCIYKVIEDSLIGEAKRTALEFIDYLRLNKVGFVKFSDDYLEEKIGCLCKNNDDYICFIAIKNLDLLENEWSIWFEYSEDFKDDSIDNKTKVFALEHINYCGDCGFCNGVETKKIFGEMFENVCSCTFRIDNPQLNDLRFLKKLVGLRIRNTVDSLIDGAKERSQESNGKKCAPDPLGDIEIEK